MKETEGEKKRAFNPNLKASFQQDLSPTPQRLRYATEVEVIKKHLGSLEKVRGELGLSRRKMAQLLMVDPSAWTRWTKNDKAPPHVYRALQWYMKLRGKHPNWHPQDPLKIQDEKLGMVQENLEKKIAHLKAKNNHLEESLAHNLAQIEATHHPRLDLEKELSIGMGWKFLVLINSVALLFNIAFQFVF